nr:MAG TPA: hypothetical protein [Caudoviricetes sp.]
MSYITVGVALLPRFFTHKQRKGVRLLPQVMFSV